MLLRALCAATRRLPTARSFATSAAPSSISSILSSGATVAPQKDAVKFLRTEEKAITWTYSELNSHVAALTTGLSELGVQSGERIISALAAHTPEHVVLLLAAARLNVTMIAFPAGGEDASNPAPLLAAVREHTPSLLFLPSDHAAVQAADAGGSGDVVATSNAILDAVAPGSTLADAAGRAGMTPLTGRATHVGDSVRLVVHTGAANVRGAASFRSLLVYAGGNGVEAAGNAGARDGLPLLVPNAVTAQAATQRAVIDDAVALGEKLSLGGDQSEKNGRLVVTPTAEKQSAAAGIAALMHQALWVCPSGPSAGSEAAAAENALMA